MTRRAVGFMMLLGALLLTSIAPALAQDTHDDTVPDDTVPADTDGAEEEATDEPAASVFGVLQYEGTPEGADEPERIPVPGVDLFVATPEGDDVGDAESDAEGAWEVALPGAGTYVLTLDPESLPDGVELRDPDDVTRELSVTDGPDQRVIFSLTLRGHAENIPDVAVPTFHITRLSIEPFR